MGVYEQIMNDGTVYKTEVTGGKITTSVDFGKSAVSDICADSMSKYRDSAASYRAREVYGLSSADICKTSITTRGGNYSTGYIEGYESEYNSMS